MDKSKIDYWSEQIRLQKESGLSQQKWCEGNEINYITMKSWGKKLKNPSLNSEPKFIELKTEDGTMTGRISFCCRALDDIVKFT